MRLQHDLGGREPTYIHISVAVMKSQKSYLRCQRCNLKQDLFESLYKQIKTML